MKIEDSKPACTIYHNPQCSKSRATLALLRENGIEPEVIEYLKSPPTAATLRILLDMLRVKPIDFVRKGEDVYRDKIAAKDLSDAQLIALMVDNPILIERPTVVFGNRAAIGRPPENVLQLLK